jgi:hypothetical protein
MEATLGKTFGKCAADPRTCAGDDGKGITRIR